MPFLYASNVAYQFADGGTIFTNLSFSMIQRRVGLVGQNGVGKSLLVSLLSGEIRPTTGCVERELPVTVFRQQPSSLLSSGLSIAEFLGKQTVFDAISRIEAGHVDQYLFDQVNEQWDLPIRFTQAMELLGVPTDPAFPCANLSGGQLARLQLWDLFEQSTGLLILDEPSNHLDSEAKLWLIQQIAQYQGPVLLISHDRMLLREVDETWELSALGLRVYGGNYDHYRAAKCAESEAVERKLSAVDKQRRQLAVTAKKNCEKAERRAAQGSRLRKSGSQPKVLLDGKKDRASASTAGRVKNEQQRDALLKEKQQALSAQRADTQAFKFAMQAVTCRTQRVIVVNDGELCFGDTSGLSFVVHSGDKVLLSGRNGSGKSTLLKTLTGELALKAGFVRLSKPVFYLDQHFGFFDAAASVLHNLLSKCEGMAESDGRTLLAGLGFRKDDVFRQSQVLSGGEKMKLAMLIVSHQPTQPFLLLDEPDNHLDIDAKCILASALHAYKGGFMLVSHDADFAADTGVTSCIDLSAN